MSYQPDSALVEFCRNPYPDEFATVLRFRAGRDTPVRILNSSALRLRVFRYYP